MSDMWEGVVIMRFILTGDTHLRQDKPRCRTDEDWIGTQKKHLDFVARAVLDNYDVPVVLVGDIFHNSQVPDKIKNMFLESFRSITVHILAGQHDLPHHKWENRNISSFGVLWSMVGNSNIKDLSTLGKYAHWGTEFIGEDTGLYFMHRLIFEKNIPPNVYASTAQQVLNEFPDAKWIFAGDQHHGFHYENNGRHVVVPGCLNRQASDFKDYCPKIWFIDTELNIIKSIYVPDDIEMVNDSYVVEEKERKSRVSAIAEAIKGNGSLSLDYKENVMNILSEQDFNQGTTDIIHDLLGV